MVEMEKQKQISMQINGLNNKTSANAEKNGGAKTDLLSDQWFK